METIKSSKEIDLIFKNGERISLPFINIYFYKSKNDIRGEVAFIAGKKNGNAIWRNKSKRRLREIYKQLNIKKPYKTLLIANKNTNKEDFNKIIKEIKNKIKRYEENI